MIKTLKLSKKHLSDPIHLLVSIGAVENENELLPNKVFMNVKDYKKMKSLLKARVKKEKPYLPSKKIETTVGMHLLNYGPVDVKFGVQEGYAIFIKD